MTTNENHIYSQKKNDDILNRDKSAAFYARFH